MLRTPLAILTLVAFFISSAIGPICPIASAQTQFSSREFSLPAPGVMVDLSPAYTPAHLSGMTIHLDNALKFDFLIDAGDENFSPSQKKQEYAKLVKYFLASLTIPDSDQWVNLSPYENNRIISDNFGRTEMGRDLLGQDYLLKQITSSLLYPEKALGKEFWNKIYGLAWKQYGTTDVPVNTFNKVWIIPDQAAVYESGNSVYVLRNHLKVMLEEDYLSLNKHTAITSPVAKDQIHSVASKIVKEIILPAIEKEVNTGKNFAQLRQIYSGMILATWFKAALKGSLLEKIYANKSRLKGINQDPRSNEEIYHKYLKAFKKGVFNYIKEDVDRYTQQVIPRKYFSGGALDFAQATEDVTRGFSNRVLLIYKPETIGEAGVNFAQIAPKRIDRADIELTEGALGRDPKSETLGFEFEGQVKDQYAGAKREDYFNESTWKVIAGTTLQGLYELLPSRWILQSGARKGQGQNKERFHKPGVRGSKSQLLAEDDIPDNFFEFITSANGDPNTQSTWDEIIQTLGDLQEGPLKGGITSIHVNVSDKRIKVDERRLLRVVKTFEAMWRALAGKGWTAAASTGFLDTLTLASQDKDDVGGYLGNYAHSAIINLKPGNILEFKIFEGDKPSALGGKGKLIDPVKLKERTDWCFSLLQFVAHDPVDPGPLAVLGLPILAGHRPTPAQVDHFIDLFFSGETAEHQNYIRSVFSSLADVPPGKSETSLQEDDQEVEAYYQSLGLGRVYQLHKMHDGYDSEILEHLQADINGLAEDLVKAHVLNKTALAYFPLGPFRGALITALEAARNQLSNQAIERFGGLVFSETKEDTFRSILNSNYVTNEDRTHSVIDHDRILGFINNDNSNIDLRNLEINQDRIWDFNIAQNHMESMINLDTHQLEQVINMDIFVGESINPLSRIRIMFNRIADFFLNRSRSNSQQRALDRLLLSRATQPADPNSDPASLANDPSQVGGIDLNSSHLNLQIKRDGHGVPLPLIQQDMDQLSRIQGFVPYIIEIRPVSGLSILSELEHKLPAQIAMLASETN